MSVDSGNTGGDTGAAAANATEKLGAVGAGSQGGGQANATEGAVGEAAAGTGGRLRGGRHEAAGGESAGTGDKSAPPEFDWPTVRDGIAAKNDKIAPWLKRFQSLDSVINAGFEANNKIRSGQYKAQLAEGASPEEVAAWRKEVGIPETPDKYEISLPPGLKYEGPVLEAVKATIDQFKPVFHKRNVPPKDAEGIVHDYLEIEERVHQAQRDLAITATAERRAEVRAEMGRDYDRNIKLMNNDLAATLGEDKAPELTSLVLHDGTRLGDHPMFVRYASAKALAVADDEALVGAEINRGGKSAEEQYREAIEVRFTDPRKYATEEHQAKLLRLARAKEKAASKGKAA